MSETIGVVVVHGIGDPVPGEAVRHLTAALAAHDNDNHTYSFAAPTEEPLVGQHPTKPYLTTLIPMSHQTGTVIDQKRGAAKALVVAEVFWGSASQLPAGLMGVIQGVIRLFFRAAVIVNFAAHNQQADPALAMLRRGYYRLAAAVSYLLTKPVFALNLLLLAAFAVYRYGGTVLGITSPHPSLGTLLGGSVVVALMAGAVVLLLNKVKPTGIWQHLTAPAWWLMGAALVWGGISRLQAPATVGDLIFWPTSAIIAIMFLVALLLVLLIVGRGLHWLLGEWRTAAAATQGPPLTVALFTLFVQYGLWVTVVPTLWTMLIDYSGQDETLVNIYGSMARSDGIQWLATIGVSCFGLLTLGWRWWRTRQIIQTKADTGPNATEAPRLIISSLISVPMALFTLAATAFVIVVGIYSFLAWPQPLWMTDFLAWLQRVGVTPLVASLILLVIPLIGGPLRLALDLVNDIITYADQKQQPLPAMADERRPVGRIGARLQLVLDRFHAGGALDRLVIVAHSQGSVIVLDALRTPTAHPLLEQLAGKIDLITMGSPATHLYQHYFPGNYPGWDNAQAWHPLFTRLRQWRHFYRIDDFVGMRLTAPDLSLVDFAQQGIGAGGHTDYWHDDRLIEQIHGLL